MQTVLNFITTFLGFIEDLQVFFFSPVSDLAFLAASRLGSGEESLAGTAFVSVISGLVSIFPAISDMSVAGLLLGSGLIFFLLWRLVRFIVGLF